MRIYRSRDDDPGGHLEGTASTAFRYLLGLIPGMFFEISALSIEPGALRTPASLAGLGYWTTVGVALFIAFIIGSAAMLWVWLIQVCIGYLYRLRKVLWIKLLSRVFRSRKFPPRPNWITSNRWLNRAFQTATFPHGLSEVQRAWHRAARQLLQEHYGINPPDIQTQTDWGVWYSVLGPFRFPELQGTAFMTALHATGWCGLGAVHVVPALCSRDYFGAIPISNRLRGCSRPESFPLVA
jgi:hypothetical protein